MSNASKAHTWGEAHSTTMPASSLQYTTTVEVHGPLRGLLPTPENHSHAKMREDAGFAARHNKRLRWNTPAPNKAAGMHMLKSDVTCCCSTEPSRLQEWPPLRAAGEQHALQSTPCTAAVICLSSFLCISLTHTHSLCATAHPCSSQDTHTAK